MARSLSHGLVSGTRKAGQDTIQGPWLVVQPLYVAHRWRYTSPSGGRQDMLVTGSFVVFDRAKNPD